MTFTILTYNLLYMRGLNALRPLLEEYHPDIICFQEFELDHIFFSSVERYGYKLADYSFSFWKFLKVYGVVTFYNPKTFTLIENETVDFSRSIYESVLNVLRGNKNSPRALLSSTFTEKKSGKRVSVYNLHLTPWSTAGHRVKQIEKSFSQGEKNERLVILGDFNHPYYRKRVELLKEEYHFKEATSKLGYTYTRKFFFLWNVRFKLDYVLYKNLFFKEIKRLTHTTSDHFPILSRFEM